MDDLRPIEVEDENIIKEAVNAELKGLERAPTDEAWQQISQRLSQHEAVEKSRRYRTGWIRSLNIAAVVMLFIGAGIWAASIIKDYRHDFAGGDISSVKYLGSQPEAADEEADALIMADDSEVDLTLESESSSGPDSVPVEDSSGSRMDDYRSDPPRVLRTFRLEGVPQITGSLTRYLYVDGERELSLLEGNSNRIADEVSAYERNGEFIPPESLKDLRKEPLILIKDNLGKPVLIWTEREKAFILWPHSDDITAEELRKLQREIQRLDSREDR